MSKTTVLYKDVAPAAERDASLSTNGAQDFSQTALLPPGDDGAAIISLERNRWLLNGNSSFVPAAPEELPGEVGYVSDIISGTDGEFSSPVWIEITFA